MNCYEYVRRQVRTRPDAVAVARADAPDLTYREVDRQARRVAAWVTEVTGGGADAVDGDAGGGADAGSVGAAGADDASTSHPVPDPPPRVALYLGTTPAYLPAVLGIWRAGRVVTPLNVMLSVEEVADVLGDVRPAAMLAADTFATNAGEVTERVPSLSDDRVATVETGGSFDPGPLPELDAVGEPGTARRSGNASEHDATSEPSATPDSDAAPEPATRLDDEVAVVMHTSGTTGRPKGVVQTHRNVAAQVEAGVSRCRVTPDDTTLVPVPLFHVGGLHGGVLMALFSGASVAIQPWWEPGEWARRVEATGATMSGLVSTMVVDAVESDAAAGYDTSSLRLCIYGGSATPEATLSAFEERFDVDALSDFYGLTEVSGLAVTYDAAALGGDRADGEGATGRRDGTTGRREGSMGSLVPAVEGRIVDVETGADLPAGEEGELLLRGDTVTPGYWERPELTAAAFEERAGDDAIGGVGADAGGRWLHTGDVVRQDDEGYLYYVERVDDLILSGGEKVAPSRVEAVLAEMPELSSVAVVGTPHDRLGEAVTAVVVPADDAGDVSESALAEDVVAFAAARDDLAGYKEPRRVEVVDSLPRTGTRKVDRAALREELG